MPNAPARVAAETMAGVVGPPDIGAAIKGMLIPNCANIRLTLSVLPSLGSGERVHNAGPRGVSPYQHARSPVGGPA